MHEFILRNWRIVKVISDWGIHFLGDGWSVDSNAYGSLRALTLARIAGKRR
jgi:hypothetical protein